MARLFGTDGVRGIAGTELGAPLAQAIGRAAAQVLTGSAGHRPTVLIGRDTRASGPMLEEATARGLAEAGADVVLLGVVPTPAVAYLVTARGADAGVMISASHNPYEYNGIKLFGADGCKLSDETEDAIEAIAVGGTAAEKAGGRIRADETAVPEYIAHLAACCRGGYRGRVLADCACGSASATARDLFRAIGVDADVIFASPDGTNINDGCGSTQIGALAARMAAGGYDVGFAFDGDADRLIAVDETGQVLDGDALLAILSEQLREQGRLKNDTVVVTTMTNLGFFKLMERRGIKTAVTQVGDRYVLEEMRRCGHTLGGEQSGHIILLDRATTGDGQLSAITLLDALAQTGKPLSALAAEMKRWPQVLVNVPATQEMKANWERVPAVSSAIAAAERTLAKNGRVNVRASGTEPLIRVMVEGEERGQVEALADSIAAAIRAAFPEGR